MTRNASVPVTGLPAPEASARAIRVLHLFGTIGRGGAELRTLDVMRVLPAAAVRFEFCALSGSADTLAPEVRSLGGFVHTCRLGLGFAPRFVALLRRRRIDVVHSHVHLASGLMLILARLAGVRRRVAHFRSTGDGRAELPTRRGYHRVMRRLLDASATDILGVSAGVLGAAWSPRWREDPRCRVVYGGVDAARFNLPGAAADVRRELGLGPDTPLVVQVGRFDPPKNQAFAVRILAALAGRSPAHLLFAGRGGTVGHARARELVDAHGLAGCVHFLGERTDVPRLLTAATASVLPSTREGLPGVLLESLAAGTPVVASDLPGVREVAERLPGVRICGLSDPPAVWADALSDALAAPPSDASRRAARATLTASPFSIHAAAKAHLAVWTAGRD